MKRELHTLYLKYDSEFRTLSKIAISEILLKIIYIKGTGASFNHIISELNSVIVGSVKEGDVEESLKHLVKEKAIFLKNNRYYIHAEYKKNLDKAAKENEELFDKVIEKYFRGAETSLTHIRLWFQETAIRFFEKFSFEWFHQITKNGKNSSNKVPNVGEVIDETLLASSNIVSADKIWLKEQFIRFIDSEDSEDNLLFWQYGITMFSARLITARNYADKLSIEMFKNSNFILDTNVLMILDLEEHRLQRSLKTLEKVLVKLNIKPIYFNITREEYIRAMSWRRDETIKVFENFDTSVLNASDCPYILTALNRGCNSEEDIKRMFDLLIDLPAIFKEDLRIEQLDYSQLAEAIDGGMRDDDLKNKINSVYIKRTDRDKRDNAKEHDAGLIAGTSFLRKGGEKSWIITNDSTLKVFAIENCVRNDDEIAIGLDVLLGLMAVNSGGVEVDAANFAPLFKNIIKFSLLPQRDTFDIRDLAFILSADVKINELPEERVIDVAKEVKKLRISGKEESAVALYLRRVIEGEKLGLTKDIQEAKQEKLLSEKRAKESYKETNVFIEEYRKRRKKELRDQYDLELRRNRILMFIIPLIVGALIYFTIFIFLDNDNKTIQWGIGMGVELIFGIIPLWPINRKLLKKNSEYIEGINEKIDNEILTIRQKAG